MSCIYAQKDADSSSYKPHVNTCGKGVLRESFIYHPTFKINQPYKLVIAIDMT